VFIKTKIRLNDDAVFGFFTCLVLFLWILMIVFPLFYIIMSSFSTKAEILVRGFFLIPQKWSVGSYRYLASNSSFRTTFRNSVIITLFGTLFSIAITTLMAYGLSKRWLPGRKILNFLVLFTMLFSGGMIPTYLIVKTLRLVNSYWAIWCLNAVAPFNMIVMKNFFLNMQQELEDAAKIDGCGEWKLFLKIIIPLAKPVIATFMLYYMVAYWNSYFQAILYLNNSSSWPLQVYLRQMLIESSENLMEAESGGFEFGPPVKMAAVIVTAVPLLVIYPFLQKYFVQGVMLGSVKG
jgi:putative aldouronate transport system permease protein